MLISRARLLFALLVLLGTSLVSAQSNPFLSSPQALNVGQTFSLEWTPTTSGPVTLTLVSGLANDTTVVSLIASSISNSGQYFWTVASDTPPGYYYYVQLYPNANLTLASYTSRFSIASAGGVTSTVTSSTSSTTSSATSISALLSSATSNQQTSAGSSSTSATSSAGPTSSGTSSGDSNSSSNGGSSNSAAIGAGVGVGVGVGIIILGLLAFFFWRRRQRNAAANNEVSQHEHAYPQDHKPGPPDVAEVDGTPYQHAELDGQGYISQMYALPPEMPGRHLPHEMGPGR